MSDGSRKLRLYNTLTRAKEDFVPIDPAHVRMYVCGPTVYDYAHIGNARPVIVFDVFYRLLRHIAGQGFWDGGKGSTKVTYVRNITDVDDKINARAARDFPDLALNEAIRKVTEATARQFHEDVAVLGCLAPDVEPRATEHVPEMIALIETLIAKGHAYVADRHALFDVKSWRNTDGSSPYGTLARRSLDDMIAGARVEVAPYKRDPMDFVLWKPSSSEEPGWESPWGRGRPGWHIECSAMADRWLWKEAKSSLSDAGLAHPHEFDIHGGGIDLTFPHHENELAQSRCAHGTDVMARYWMHNGFLQVEGRKMAKSEGNFVTIHELLNTETFAGRKWPGEVLRLAMLMTHYREPIDFSVRKLEEADNILAKWRDAIGTAAPRVLWHAPAGEAAEPLLDDLNTPVSVMAVHRLAEEGRVEDLAGSMAFLGVLPGGLQRLANENQADGMRELARLGANGAAVEDVRSLLVALSGGNTSDIDSAIARRLTLIHEKNWIEADRIRDELLAQGIQLKDGKDPATGQRVTTWEVKR
jgi:cysteinyl-tRNA synthetase